MDVAVLLDLLGLSEVLGNLFLQVFNSRESCSWGPEHGHPDGSEKGASSHDFFGFGQDDFDLLQNHRVLLLE